MNFLKSRLLVCLLSGLMLGTGSASAGSDQYIGEVFLFGFNFCPRTTLNTDGQLLPINSNQALFSLIGTTYGGDGRTTFGLPDLRGRGAFGYGTGPGLTTKNWGQRGGSENHTMTILDLPSHNHLVNATNSDGNKAGPGRKLLAAAPPGGTGAETIYSLQGPTALMSSQMIAPTGNNSAMNVLAPYLTMNFCIATTGIYPSRS